MDLPSNSQLLNVIWYRQLQQYKEKRRADQISKVKVLRTEYEIDQHKAKTD